uniref:Transposase n=1 Tax=Romanomermis culicivorax TaxID=13658 RepID=A0A915JHY3_ROMCU
MVDDKKSLFITSTTVEKKIQVCQNIGARQRHPRKIITKQWTPKMDYIADQSFKSLFSNRPRNN